MQEIISVIRNKISMLSQGWVMLAVALMFMVGAASAYFAVRLHYSTTALEGIRHELASQQRHAGSAATSPLPNQLAPKQGEMSGGLPGSCFAVLVSVEHQKGRVAEKVSNLHFEGSYSAVMQCGLELESQLRNSKAVLLRSKLAGASSAGDDGVDRVEMHIELTAQEQAVAREGKPS